jgi:hypothetical protein
VRTRPLVVLAVLAFAVPSLLPSVGALATEAAAKAASVAPASVAPPGWNPPAGFVTADYDFFVQVGTPVFGVGFNAEPAGSQLFTAYLTVVLYPLTNTTHTAYLDLYEPTSSKLPFSYTTIVVNPNSTATVELPVPSSLNYVEDRLEVDGTNVYYYTETPVTIFPIPALLVGGVDLVAIIALVEFLVIGLPLVWWAGRLAKRAVHAPRLKAVLWLHGLVLSFFALYVSDFPSLNVFFGGWEWLLFPIPTMIFLFFWELGRHNRDETVQIDRAHPRALDRMGFDFWTIHVATDARGNLNLIGRLWRDTFFRLTGHQMPIYIRREDGGQLEPAAASVVLRRVEDATEELRRALDFARGSHGEPTDDFEVTNRISGDEDIPARRFFVASMDPYDIVWPRWTIHKDVPTPPRMLPNGTRIEGPGTKRVLCWPHVIDGHCEIRLASVHYANVWSVGLGWREAEDLVKLNDDLELENWVLKTRLHRLAEQKAAPRLAAHLDILSMPTDDLAPADAAAYVEAKRGAPQPEGESTEPEQPQPPIRARRGT